MVDKLAVLNKEHNQQMLNHPIKSTPSVLVVEDDPSVRDLYETILLDEGYLVLTAADGQEGLEQLTKIHPDLILLDLGMPRMDGAEFCRRLRNSPSTADVPVIVISAQIDSRRKAREIGANGSLGKPFDLDEFLRCVERMVAEKAA